ncbi:hypothetical protein A0H81_09935 [Grifola frondosa]|uniref:Uncharacterized protein n=1 Tax=Grifola frondosa TaxID=5627 RepID=A0A1C7LZD0_GRIFR|nr:hypothetical protein A0H81_09935 [Grifola frondosa]
MDVRAVGSLQLVLFAPPSRCGLLNSRLSKENGGHMKICSIHTLELMLVAYYDNSHAGAILRSTLVKCT